MVIGSSAARSVQLSGISHWRPPLIDEADSLFTAVIFARERFELAARKRMEGMRDPESEDFSSTNRCSATPFPADWVLTTHNEIHGAVQ